MSAPTSLVSFKVSCRMPRLSTSLLRRAWSIDPLLTLLLRPCRDLESAQNELRWLREHAIKTTQASRRKLGKVSHSDGWQGLLRKLGYARSKGKPLQYLLASEYFGELEIICKPGVLIPRPETAAAVTYLVERLFGHGDTRLPEELRILDLCTGTGCIPLIFAQQARCEYDTKVQLKLLGVDISSRAIDLAKRNQKQFAEQQSQDPRHGNSVSPEERPESMNSLAAMALGNIEFIRADILTQRTNLASGDPPSLLNVLQAREENNWDIVISNPPYISPLSYQRDTAKSVRHFEPKLALVPPVSKASLTPESQGDLFYPTLLSIADHVQAKILLVEVADLDQARRVATMAAKTKSWEAIEIWRDEPRLPSCYEETDGALTSDDEAEVFYDYKISIIGRGNGRCVFCWRGDAARWIKP